MSEPRDLPRIDYAPKPRRRRVSRYAISISIAIALVTVAYRYVPPIWRHARMLYWQRQCMNFALPSDQVVYEEGPDALKISTQGSGYKLFHPPERWRKFGVANPVAIYNPSCAKEFDPLGPLEGVGGFIDGSTIFLHELDTRDGQRRLVWIKGGIFCSLPFVHEHNGYYEVETIELIFKPGQLWSEPIQRRSRDSLSSHTGIAVLQNLRIFAGQADLTDHSHFTIRYEAWGKTDVLDGWLDPSGDFVTFKPRNPPTPVLWVPGKDTP